MLQWLNDSFFFLNSQRLCSLDDSFRSDAQNLEDLGARSRKTESLNADNSTVQTNVLPPALSDSGLDGNTGTDVGGQDFVSVGFRLGFETLEGRQGDNTGGGAQGFGGLDGVLEFGTGRKEDGLQRSGFLQGDVTTP
jgi:hypothetical protein